MEVKPGTRLQSTVCETQVIIVRGGGDVDLRCGGAEMAIVESPAVIGPPATGHVYRTLLGKRYEDPAAAIEVLCVKSGVGSLALGSTPLSVKAAKALPASD
jgi:hypothetical protein